MVALSRGLLKPMDPIAREGRATRARAPRATRTARLKVAEPWPRQAEGGQPFGPAHHVEHDQSLGYYIEQKKKVETYLSERSSHGRRVGGEISREVEGREEENGFEQRAVR